MSPRTEESNQRIRQEQRKKILDASVSIFARKGFSATKMADIATAADISYGLLYHYFTNKEHIFVTLVQDDLEATARLMQNALKQPGTPWDRLHWLISQILQGIQHDPESFMVILQAFTNEAIPQELKGVIYRSIQNSAGVLTQLILDGQAAGQIVADDPLRLVRVLLACIQGLATEAIFHEYVSAVRFPDVNAESVLRILKS